MQEKKAKSGGSMSAQGKDERLDQEFIISLGRQWSPGQILMQKHLGFTTLDRFGYFQLRNSELYPHY